MELIQKSAFIDIEVKASGRLTTSHADETPQERYEKLKALVEEMNAF